MRAYRLVIFLRAPYMPDYEAPAMTVMLIDDMKVPIEEATTSEPGVFLVHDVFECKDGPLDTAIAAAMIRAQEREQDELNMATLYHYSGGMLRMVREQGHLGSAPAPLATEDIAIVLRQLTDHPNYKRQTVVVTSERDGGSATIRDGHVTTLPGGN